MSVSDDLTALVEQVRVLEERLVDAEERAQEADERAFTTDMELGAYDGIVEALEDHQRGLLTLDEVYEKAGVKAGVR